MKAQRISIPVSGLGCGGGGAQVLERILAKVPGVTAVYVNPAAETAFIEGDPEVLRLTEVLGEIERAGYRVAGAASIQPSGSMTQ